MEYYTIIGIDVSDKTSKICMMTKIGGERRIIEEKTVETTREAFAGYLANKSRDVAVTFETGAHCRWMARFIRDMGFKVFVANPAKLRALTHSNTKNDRNDARELARYALADVELLHPVFLRPETHQQMIRLLEVRTSLVATRTKYINQIRGFAKSIGFRIPKKSAKYFHLLDRTKWQEDLESACWVQMDLLKVISMKIAALEKQMRTLADSPEFKNDVERVQQIFGVGFFCSVAYVAVLGGNYARFKKARDVGPYLGVVPRQDQSGNLDKQLSITKAGSQLLLRLLTEAAQVVLKDSSRMTDLKLKGMRIAERGGKNAKKRAIIATVRGLAVTMMALLKHPEREYKMLSDENQEKLEQQKLAEGNAAGAYETLAALA